MAAIFKAILGLLALSLVSWAFYSFVYYPKAVQEIRHTAFHLVANEKPCTKLWPGLVVGSIHNCTDIDIVLYQGGSEISRGALVKGGDRSTYHLPLNAEWLGQSVLITDRDGRERLLLKTSGGGR